MLPFEQQVEISFAGTELKSVNQHSIEQALIIAREHLKNKRLDLAENQLGLLLMNHVVHPEIYQMLGAIRLEQKKFQEAHISFLQVLKLEPENAEANYYAGQALVLLNKPEKAIPFLEQASSKLAENPSLWQVLGAAYYYTKDYPKACESYEQAIKLKPNYAGAWSNLGASYHSQAQYHEAKRCYLESFKYSKNVRDAYNNYANVAQCLGDLNEAVKYYKKALKIDPNYNEPAYSLAEIDLQLGRFTQGWKNYDLRKIKREHDIRHFNHPEWKGQKLSEEKLLIFSEQGIGDVVMFGTIIPEVMQLCSKIVLEVDYRMVDLFARSFPQIEVIPRSMRFIEGMTVQIPGVSFQISIADLAQYYRNSFADFPGTSYLQADPEKRALWKHRFSQLKPGLNVGISWRGGKDVDVGTRRSAPIQLWKDLFNLPGINFINLQYGDCTEDKAWVAEHTNSVLHDWPECDPKKDLETFSAQIQELDLVLSIDNATVHFAGGLGAKTIVLLSALPDWRWTLNTTSSYWYSNLTLLRQEQQLEWQPVFKRAKQELVKLAQIKTTQESSTTKSTIPINYVEPRKRKCAIVSLTLTSMNHAAEENLKLLQESITTKQGAFCEFIPIRVMMPDGVPSLARGLNFGAHQAREFGCEWSLILPPTSRIVPNLFDVVSPYLEEYDAIWGEIYTYQHDLSDARLLTPQMPATNDFQTMIHADPASALGPLFMLRSTVGIKTEWVEAFAQASEYDGYARLWQNERCIKLDQPLSADHAPNGNLYSPFWTQASRLVQDKMLNNLAKAS